MKTSNISASPEHLSEDLNTTAGFDRESVLRDYYICRISRELSTYIRRDVLTGRAKFGIADDGKEVFQVAQAYAIKAGDWRADYYRGHTLLLALGIATPEQILAQLYADNHNDPFSKGRQMNNHHCTPMIDEQGEWLNLKDSTLNISSGISPTAGQMARGLGLAQASKVYRQQSKQLEGNLHSEKGNEICWTSIGDASTSEGVFWETINAAGVMQVPLVAIVADDGYGISVPTKYQTTKASISEALAGMEATDEKAGYRIERVEGWDYPKLRHLFSDVADGVRKTHQPTLLHIHELTQPSGHSTSGSHERYKDAERMKFEKDWDAVRQFRLWMIGSSLADEAELVTIEKQAKVDAREARQRAWDAYLKPYQAGRDEVVTLIQKQTDSPLAAAIIHELNALDIPNKREQIDAVRNLLQHEPQLADGPLGNWLRRERQDLKDLMGRHLLSETPLSPMRVKAEPAIYSEDAKQLNGFEILQRFFDAKMSEIPELLAFGEDVGYIGDVNQGFAGLQAKYGEERIFDTGIREWTIMGQALGLSIRGLRPIAEIQYLDYIFYAISLLADDTATLRWRTAGQQHCPMIVRTRGHRLEGIWHSGSYLAALINTMRGIHLCVPRNMVQAAGLYNTLLSGDDPGIVVEVLNGYRHKETLPDNLVDMKVPLGVPEILRPGTDVTIVSYGACIRICLAAAERLAALGVDAQIIDVQTLLPFDVENRITKELQQTHRLLIVDEDAPGGTSAYMLQEILERQHAFRYLDAAPKTLTSAAHRPAYGDDGDYASKPQLADIVDAALELVRF